MAGTVVEREAEGASTWLVLGKVSRVCAIRAGCDVMSTAHFGALF
jgi:hypothetical protein